MFDAAQNNCDCYSPMSEGHVKMVVQCEYNMIYLHTEYIILCYIYTLLIYYNI